MKKSDKELTQRFLISFPRSLVERVDAFAKARYSTRTQFIREAVVMRLRSEHLVDSSVEDLPIEEKARHARLNRFMEQKLDFRNFDEDCD